MMRRYDALVQFSFIQPMFRILMKCSRVALVALRGEREVTCWRRRMMKEAHISIECIRILYFDKQHILFFLISIYVWTR